MLIAAVCAEKAAWIEFAFSGSCLRKACTVTDLPVPVSPMSIVCEPAITSVCSSQL